MTSATPVATKTERILINDEELVDFVINGYAIIETDLGDEFNRSVFDQLEALPDNPGDAILETIPALNEVYSHPKVAGALASVLGHDYHMYQHRHCHRNMPGTPSQMWHLDGGAGTTDSVENDCSVSGRERCCQQANANVKTRRLNGISLAPNRDVATCGV